MRTAKELLEKFKNGECTPQELAILHKWIHEIESDSPTTLTDNELIHAENAIKERFNHILRKNKVKKLWLSASAAAALLLIALFTHLHNKILPSPSSSSLFTKKTDVLPGGNSATITFADGNKISLEKLETGASLSKNGNMISKSESGEITYLSVLNEGPIEYHLIETPLKGMHKIILHDGSKIWLNSLSSIRFPNRFINKREVEVTGEVYFEIKKDVHKPFYVLSKGQRISVLGTHFNVKSYNDEPYTKTTLIEGSVNITSLENNETLHLVPGDQSTLHNGKIKIRQVNTANVIDWKNGDFVFNGETLPQIMKRISRWYGVNVLYEKGLNKTQTFSGQVSRSKNLSEVISALSESSDLNFTIEENRILIKNKT